MADSIFTFVEVEYIDPSREVKAEKVWQGRYRFNAENNWTCSVPVDVAKEMLAYPGTFLVKIDAKNVSKALDDGSKLIELEGRIAELEKFFADGGNKLIEFLNELPLPEVDPEKEDEPPNRRGRKPNPK